MNCKEIIISHVLSYQPKKNSLLVCGDSGTCGTYITLFTSGRLNNYLADIDRQAQERMERLTEQMKRVQGITEQLKAENALEWTQRMNNIRACAKEIVEKEIIFA